MFIYKRGNPKVMPSIHLQDDNAYRENNDIIEQGKFLLAQYFYIGIQ